MAIQSCSSGHLVDGWDCENGRGWPADRSAVPGDSHNVLTRRDGVTAGQLDGARRHRRRCHHKGDQSGVAGIQRLGEHRDPGKAATTGCDTCGVAFDLARAPARSGWTAGTCRAVTVASIVVELDRDAPALVREYLLLGLRFDRIESGYVDAFTGDPALRAAVANEPSPDPAELTRQAHRLIAALPGGLDDARADYLRAHLRALACAGRKFDGESVGFVDEVRDYFDVDIAKGDIDSYRQAHARLDRALGGSGPLADRMAAYRRAEEIPPERLEACIRAFSSALRDRVRIDYPLPDAETITYQVVTDQPWSGFNYYLGNYRSTVAVNADLKQLMSNLPRLVAHESYPGHHTEHCRKEAGLVVARGQAEQTIFLVNTPQCLMAEGLADLALYATIGSAWGGWAGEIYADLGLRFDGELAEEISAASAALADVRQDAALMLHDEHRDVDEVAAFLRRWLLVDDTRSRQMLRFLASPLWRAYTSTYVEGYRLLRAWLDDPSRAGGTPTPSGVSRAERFTRLLDEPLIPSALRAELGG